MKATYKVLYKNGHEDIFEQEAPQEALNNISNTITEAFTDNLPGMLTFGDGKENGYFVRLDDVTRVHIKL